MLSLRITNFTFATFAPQPFLLKYNSLSAVGCDGLYTAKNAQLAGVHETVLTMHLYIGKQFLLLTLCIILTAKVCCLPGAYLGIPTTLPVEC